MPAPLPIGPLSENWFADSSVAPDLKTQWVEKGFAVMRGVYGPRRIRAYNQIVASVRQEIDTGRDEHGFGDRIGQLHQKHPPLLDLASNIDILAFLRWAFNDEPVVFGSLNFERGTQQDAHIDAIFFWPEPAYAMAGCWIALEDIHPDSGPLFYVAGSHKWPFYRSEDVAATRPELAARRAAARDPAMPAAERAAIVSALANAWTEDFRKLEAQYASQRVELPIKAGDVVFWHSLLAHGGAARLNPALSRKSAVFHLIGKRTRLYTFEQFMLFNSAEIRAQIPQDMNLRQYNKHLAYMTYPYFVTYTPQETVHPVQPPPIRRPLSWLRRRLAKEPA